MNKQFLSPVFAVVLAFGAGAPLANAATYSNGTATATFNVTLTLQANCTIAATPLNFGTSGVLTTALNQQTSVAVTCTNTTPYNVGLDAGTVAGSSIASRLMAGTATGNTGTTVGFQLYQDAGRATVWGNTQGTNTVAGTGTGSAQSITVYGQVPAQATPKPDTYQTTVTATVYF
ncbi:Csu type fimbrial protein [Paraburkholderia megapolitana]|uniref:Spore coat protein U (SCPU) domain-containing protein n=1 Tax=Paraburkholderia megapolitana TaxID=420953 RepID=A0A1I3Q2R3_9BURK|nr:spore coat U domain-containing protein [Paraburkholderia megapolitana]QDQ81099.1 spore coat U domain-containing protein [Paraburkholderia megapolitana]SFJ28173.1 Spore coat protein U (SCPU) domain-containing protein [Paraburkholderia megapolitana]